VRSWLLAVLACVVAACGSSGQHAPQQLVAGDAQNGQTVKVHVGDTLRVALNSTVWTISGSSDPVVLEQQGQQVIVSAPPGTCYVGQGCGTTTADFRAVKAGTAEVDASRVSCGEARRCVGPEGVYRVTVIVGS
jgi:predicted secreted protein